jgi:nucleoside-diphosphate-sugar epimerase
MGTTDVFECARLPRFRYAAYKLWSEHLAEFYNNTYDIEILSLRVSGTMGYGRLACNKRIARPG